MSWANVVQTGSDPKVTVQMHQRPVRVVQTKEQKEQSMIQYAKDERTRLMPTNLDYLIKRFGSETSMLIFWDTSTWEGPMNFKGVGTLTDLIDDYYNEYSYWMHGYSPDKSLIVDLHYDKRRQVDIIKYRLHPPRDYLMRIEEHLAHPK